MSIDQVVVITGASSGIGRPTALHLASRGAKVVLGARRETQLRALAQEIEAAGGTASARAAMIDCSTWMSSVLGREPSSRVARAVIAKRASS